MSRIESIGLTRSASQPASLNEARRALLNPDLRSVILGSHVDSIDLRERVAMATDAHAALDAAARASLAGRLFVVDHAPLVDDMDFVLADMNERFIQPPFDVTPIFVPGFEGGSCPLFIVTREAEGLVNLVTAIPMKNDETFFWVVPGFAAGYEEFVGPAMTALLAAINSCDLKPIGPPRVSALTEALGYAECRGWASFPVPPRNQALLQISSIQRRPPLGHEQQSDGDRALTSGVGPTPAPASAASNRNRSMDDERATYPKTDTTSAIAFLKALRPAGPWVLTAIVPDGPTTTQSFEASDEAGATRFIKSTNHAGQNVYFTGNSCGRPGRKPKKADMTGAIMLHADSDPRDGETIEAAKKRILAAYDGARSAAVDHCRLRQRPTGALAARAGVRIPEAHERAKQQGLR